MLHTDSFIIHIITEDFYEGIDENKTGKRPLPIGKNKKVIGLFKLELGGKIIEEFCVLRAKTWAYLMVDDSKDKKKQRNKKI